jgi:prophage regulatory protein
MQTTQVLRPHDVAKLLQVSKPTIYRWRADGTLPPSIKYGPKVVGWPVEVIEQWLEEKSTQSEGM